MHLVPEVLARESGRGEAHQIGEIGGLGPIGKGPFASRGTCAGQDGGDERFADGQPVADLDAGWG